MWVRALHAKSYNEIDQSRIHTDAVVQPYISAVVARQQQLDAHIDFLVSAKVRDLHYIEQCGLHKVLGLGLWDNLRISAYDLGLVLMQS
jgi:hypothetical protein